MALLCLLLCSIAAFAQTDPVPQALPYTQDFSALPHNSTSYPPGWRGHRISTGATTTFITDAPTEDLLLAGNSTATTTSGGLHNYNGKLGILTASANNPALVLSVNTEGRYAVQVGYTLMTIRNPWNGGTNTRLNRATLQFRVGTSGPFTTLEAPAYATGTTAQTAAVTDPQGAVSYEHTLPFSCNYQPVVQLRWVVRDSLGSGARPSIAVDDVSVDGIWFPMYTGGNGRGDASDSFTTPAPTADLFHGGNGRGDASNAFTNAGVASAIYTGGSGRGDVSSSYTAPPITASIFSGGNGRGDVSNAYTNTGLASAIYTGGSGRGDVSSSYATPPISASIFSGGSGRGDVSNAYTNTGLASAIYTGGNGRGDVSSGYTTPPITASIFSGGNGRGDVSNAYTNALLASAIYSGGSGRGDVSDAFVPGPTLSSIYNGGIGRGDVMDAINLQPLTCFVDAAHWCMGDTAAVVSFSTSLAHGSGNIFTVELSDANGDFGSPLVIGSHAGTTSGSITVTVPDVPHGTDYLVRIVSSDPPFNGLDNGAPITLDTRSTWYADLDGDGAGDPLVDSTACAQPAAYVLNSSDGCPTDPLKTTPGLCGCGTSEFDLDNDGTPDCIDGCPMDPNKTAPGTCGCGYTDTDSDGDGIADCNDGCPNLPGTIGTPCDDGVAYTINDVLIHDCTCQGTFTVAANYPRRPGSGYALDLDGVNDMVITTNSSSLNPGTGSFTVEGWFKSDLSSASATQYIVIKYGYGNTGGGPGGLEPDTWSLYVWADGRGGFTLRDAGSVQQDCSTTVSVLDGRWHHLAGVRDVENGRMKLYLDGVLEYDQPLVVTGDVAPQNEMTVGANYTYNSNVVGAAFNGRIDEVRYWSASLTTDQLRAHICKKDLSTHPRSSDLILYYRFDEGSANTVQDLAGQNTNGTLINATVATAWVLSGAALGDASAYNYNGTAIQFDDGTGTVFTADDLTGAPIGGHIYRVDQAPNDLSPAPGFTAFDTTEYYGTFFVRGTAPTSSPWWYYNANPVLTNVFAEPSLLLGRRSGNDGGAFAHDAGQSQDVANDVMHGSAYGRGEFIIGVACSYFGASCDDGDACTVNDMIDALCGCSGTPDPIADDDGDGVPNCDDPCPYAPNVVNGVTCDDGDPSTINDMVTNCYCQGCTPARFGNDQGHLALCDAAAEFTYTCWNLSAPGAFTSTWSLNGVDLGQPDNMTITAPNPGPGEHTYLLIAANECGTDTFRLYLNVDDQFNAGLDSTRTTCNATGGFSMNELLSADADQGGTWFNDMLNWGPGSNPYFQAFETTPGTYLMGYTFEFDGCPSDTALFTIHITDGGLWVYYDEDHDGYGAPGNMAVLCELVPGYSLNSDDCNDADPNLTVAGHSCDDGNPATMDDMVTADCACVGTPSAVVLQLRAFLDGPFVATSGWMHDSLRVHALVPLSEPYSAAGYALPGGGGESIDAAALNTTGADAIVDWVVVELRDADDPTVLEIARCLLIQRDGDVVDATMNTSVVFQAALGEHHIAIRHRNHLGVMTAVPITLGAAPTLLDLTLTATPVHGTQARKPIGAHALLWSGDVNHDERVQYTGQDNDRDPILQAIGGVVPTTVMNDVYAGEDVNMDGRVQYTGEGNDRDPILMNIGGVVPTNVRFGQLP